MKGKDIISAGIGGAVFAIPYLALATPIAPAAILGCAAFAGTELILSSFSKETLKDTDLPLYMKISNAKKQNKEISSMISKIDSQETRGNLTEITKTVNQIIDTVERHPKKGKQLNNFFDFYLPTLLKIIKKYDDVENHKLSSKEGKSFMVKGDKMIGETNKSFKSLLASLYSNDIMDADADMKVYDMMLKADGIASDADLVKGSDKDEK